MTGAQKINHDIQIDTELLLPVGMSASTSGLRVSIVENSASTLFNLSKVLRTGSQGHWTDSENKMNRRTCVTTRSELTQ